MTTNMALATQGQDGSIIERVLVDGDLSPLNPQQRVVYYNRVCESLGLNPLTKPFAYLRLNGKLVLYALKDCTEQLRKRDKVSIVRLEQSPVEGVYVVTAYARNAEGREDTDIGAVSIEGLKGEARANAMMKAITKAKRRATLSICGLGMLDETEIDSIPDARPVHVDIETGVIEGETRQIEGKSQPAPVRADVAAIRKLATDKGISEATLIETVGRDYGVETLEELTEADAALLKARLEKAPKKAA